MGGEKIEEDLCVLMVLILAVGMTAAASAEAGKKDKYIIGMAQCNLGEPWRVAMNDQIAAAAKDYPMFEIIYSDAAQDNSKQIADIENFIQMGVDLIITSPNEARPLTNVVKKAYEAGIPVILLDRKIEGDTYTQFIGADNVLIGRECGKYVATVLLPDGGKICEIKGLEGTSGGIDRDNGFREGIAENPKCEIIAANNADWLREKAITVAEKCCRPMTTSTCSSPSTTRWPKAPTSPPRTRAAKRTSCSSAWTACPPRTAASSPSWTAG
jgi:ribose transport system substrate-binding protein